MQQSSGGLNIDNKHWHTDMELSSWEIQGQQLWQYQVRVTIPNPTTMT